MKKWIPILVIIAFMAAAYFLGLPEYFSFEMIKKNRQVLLTQIDAHPFLMPCLYILLYIIVIALSLPGGTILTLIGGFLFGIPWATLYVVIGATIGATLIFLAARTALGDILRKKAGPFLKKMEGGFQKNAASYLLFLRFIPLFPFWLVNIAPALFNVSIGTYIWTTFVGILPGSYIYTQAGRGLGAIFESGETFSINTIFNNQMKLALVLLALFSLIPILVKRIRHDRQ